MTIEIDFTTFVRKRPGMHLGDAGAWGLSNLASLALDSVCEVPGAARTKVRVQVKGRRVRIEASKCPRELSEWRARLADPGNWDGNFLTQRSELVVVSALSSWFSFQTASRNRTERLVGARGRLAAVRPVGRAACMLEFEPDERIFGRRARVDENWVIKRARELAACLPGLRTEVINPSTHREACFRFPNGMTDLVAEAAGFSALPTWASRATVGGVTVDAAIHFAAWRARPSPWLSFANFAPTEGGGSHERGLEAALKRAVGEGFEDARRLALGAISVQVPTGDRLQFVGSTREVLRVEGLDRQLEEALAPDLEAHLHRFASHAPWRPGLNPSREKVSVRKR